MSNKKDNNHSCTASDRFDRIEKWLEKLAESTEQVITLITETRHNRSDIDDHESRIRVLERLVTQNAMWKDISMKIALAVGAGVVGYIIKGLL